MHVSNFYDLNEVSSSPLSLSLFLSLYKRKQTQTNANNNDPLGMLLGRGQYIYVARSSSLVANFNTQLSPLVWPGVK
jgi:hypothetical protein